MALTCPTGFVLGRLRQQVAATRNLVAAQPGPRRRGLFGALEDAGFDVAQIIDPSMAVA